MSVSVLKCPQCGAPLAPPSRFAREATCPFCTTVVTVDPFVVSTERFKEAARSWGVLPESEEGFLLRGVHWRVRGPIARGARSDLYLVESARWPRARGVLKVHRADGDAALESEWSVLDRLHQAPGAGALGDRLPRPVAHGRLGVGRSSGRAALLLAFAPGYLRTLEDVRRAFPEGVAPEIAVWVFRRVLELLAFLHRNGVVHRAVTPEHVMVEEGEHGARLVGYGDARVSSSEAERGLDLRMAAGAIAHILGGDAESGRVPARVPAGLARPLDEVCHGRFAGDAWALRESLGVVARSLFGPPSFHPIRWPDGARGP